VRAFTFPTDEDGKDGNSKVIPWRTPLPLAAFDQLANSLADAVELTEGPYRAFFLEDVHDLTMVGPLFDIDVLWDHFLWLYKIPQKDLIPGTRHAEPTRRRPSSSKVDTGLLSPGPDYAVPGGPKIPPKKRSVFSVGDENDEVEIDEELGAGRFGDSVDNDALLGQKEAPKTLDNSDTFGIRFSNDFAHPLSLYVTDLARIDSNECLHDRCADAYVSKGIICLMLLACLTCFLIFFIGMVSGHDAPLRFVSQPR